MGGNRSLVDVGSLVAQEQFLTHIVLEILNLDAVQALFESHLANYEIGAMAAIMRPSIKSCAPSSLRKRNLYTAFSGASNSAWKS